MKKNYYIYYLSESVQEGGMARNKAFYEKFLSLNTITLNVYSKNSIVRFWVTLRVICTLLFLRGRTVFIHQGTLLFIFPVFFMRTKFLRKISFYLLGKVSKKNKFIIEVNDLIYEQSIDLELEVDEIFRVLQQYIYTIKNCNYIFASNEMESYVCSKYSILPKHSKVIINGAPQVRDYSSTFKNEAWMNSDKSKFVYAGSLNKGRQIEELLLAFSGEDNNLLIILGNDGEWLNTIKLPKNILYLGNFEEHEAHYIVSKCDIGIIPYNADKFYYNLCFPTKVSFYLTAGLPILSTPLKELQNIFKNEEMILFVPFVKWKSVLNNFDKNKMLKMKQVVTVSKESYYWTSLLDEIELNF